MRLFGAEFALLEPEQRRQDLLTALEERRILLIWDNFESAYSLPDPTGATAPLDDKQRAELAEFLARVAARGAGAVVITSRTREDWLGPVPRIDVGGLGVAEAAEYTDWLLAPFPRTRAMREQRAFGELLKWLDGHPLCMRLTLPQLDGASPQALLDGLTGATASPATHERTAGRIESLAACVSYSFTHLPADDRDALTALALFYGVADADVLAEFSRDDAAPEQYRGLDRDAWERILNRAAKVGLLTDIEARMYRIHPALPAYLTDQWRATHPDEFDRQREQATRALLNAYAAFSRWLMQQLQGGDATSAVAIISWQRHTLSAMLSYGLDHALWQQAQAVAQPLDEYWDLRGLHVEARGWVDRARVAVEAPDGTPPALDSPAGKLWIFLVGAEANRRLVAGRLDKAERTYQFVLDALGLQEPSPDQRRYVAETRHQLGMVAQLRGEWDQAEEWYRRSLTITEKLGYRPGMAKSYHQLGSVAQDRGEWVSFPRALRSA